MCNERDTISHTKSLVLWKYGGILLSSKSRNKAVPAVFNWKNSCIWSIVKREDIMVTIHYIYNSCLGYLFNGEDGIV